MILILKELNNEKNYIEIVPILILVKIYINTENRILTGNVNNVNVSLFHVLYKINDSKQFFFFKFSNPQNLEITSKFSFNFS